MLIAIAFLTLNALAQDKHNRKNEFKNLSAEEVATLQTKNLTLQLDLTESQQTAVKSLVLKEAKYREQKKAEREEKKKNDDFKKPTKEERYAMANDRLDRQIEMKKQMKAILNAAQYEKWEAIVSEKRKGMFKKRKAKRSERRN